MDLKIQQESPKDFQEVYKINTIAFGQENEAKLVDLLRSGKGFIPELSLVAVQKDEVVGHILFTKIEIVNQNYAEESLALAPMAVHPAHQKKGIGGELIKAGLAKASAMGFKSVIVLGHEHYYPKFGFVPTTKWNISAPFEVPANAFLGIELVKGALKNTTGTVQYPKEFQSV